MNMTDPIADMLTRTRNAGGDTLIAAVSQRAPLGGRTLAGTPVRAQLLGSDPASMADNAAHLAALGPEGIDLNFGCPAKVVNRHGGGAALLQEPERIATLADVIYSDEAMRTFAKHPEWYEDSKPINLKAEQWETMRLHPLDKARNAVRF